MVNTNFVKSVNFTQINEENNPWCIYFLLNGQMTDIDSEFYQTYMVKYVVFRTNIETYMKLNNKYEQS